MPATICAYVLRFSPMPVLTKTLQCEKHSRKEEALGKLREGAKFDDVAREFSEDKARQGKQTEIKHLTSIELTAAHRGIAGVESSGFAVERFRGCRICTGAKYDWKPQVLRGQNQRRISYYHGRRSQMMIKYTFDLRLRQVDTEIFPSHKITN